AVSGVVPTLAAATDWPAVVGPTATVPKSSETGEVEICVPVPAKATVCGLVGALSLNVNVPLRTPIRVGVKVTLTVQLAPGATVVPQVLLPMAKSPLMLILLTLSVPAPVFVSVTTFPGLVVPSTLLPKARLVADSVTAGGACTPVPKYPPRPEHAR